ncbi:MAG: metallophosphoesterase [Gammaproteobacteria bacterium]|nr:metallophosphoesterase [Gammaproteobacteria bacterium]
MSEIANADFSFVFITDTHIMAGGQYQPASGAFELDTQHTLSAVVEAIERLDHAPDFVVIGGDLASPDILDREATLSAADYEPSYELLVRTLAPLSCPVHMILGNHDHRRAFKTVVRAERSPDDSPYRYSFGHQGYRFIFLDSHVSGQHAGRLDSAQCLWLKEELDAHVGVPTFVFVHHPPWSVDHPKLDTMGLEDGDAFIDQLRPYPDVKWVLCGHVHLDHHVQEGGLTLLSSASTCFQVDKLDPNAGALAGPPALRTVRIRGERVATRTVQVPA